MNAGGERGEDRAGRLGCASFRRDFGVDYAYLSGSMYRGIASKELVVAMGRAGFMGFLGAAGLSPERVTDDIAHIRRQLAPHQPFGVNLLCDLQYPARETANVDMLLAHGVRVIEASAFIKVTPALVQFHLSGLRARPGGGVARDTRIVAKVSRPEVAREFMQPAPQDIVAQLVAEGRVTREQAALARGVPVAQDLTVEADSGGHTDRGVSTVLLPSMQSLRLHTTREFGYGEKIRLGLAGGIGTPHAVAAAFALGADYVMTGSINQCTVEAGISDVVKDRLQTIDVQDTDYCPAGDMFEIGAQVQVLKKGGLFPARANRLHALYQSYDSWEEIPQGIRRQIQDAYFKKSVDEVWRETCEHLRKTGRESEIERAERSPKRRMALIFRWYYGYSSRLSFVDSEYDRANVQIHTGPALGAFNQWARGAPWESWRNRHPDRMALALMREASSILSDYRQALA
ncbi:PfaD family polyunsaturated fatty acid/polyketide biosynthesis protein [Streptacidiphilus sp. PB12-B1b]|uniref:PfaD family polyunsaturated fatty acid/polyketide biosynthesis protein n=1 Tax=Streptacidiphilus sp. PB12-B1b TaxID=2705012 RepID=UPI0015FB2348|nr:PfaD family polyunsaturated fatty acid/polyketide biosynthesis protein [Streptacidiphilus sp. PB12-B1b]QMU78252.1 PfaD family polyunsaturated fatty acid/polyketide biosynthesis protein [Streptacidiphilus sp. PB12-B1b]